MKALLACFLSVVSSEIPCHGAARATHVYSAGAECTAAYCGPDGTLAAGYAGVGVIVSRDRGATWQLYRADLYPSSMVEHAGTLYVGSAIPQCYTIEECVRWEPTHGLYALHADGKIEMIVGDWSGRDLVATDDRLVATSNGGLSWSSDGGNTWDALTGLPRDDVGSTAEVFHVEVDAAGRLYAIAAPFGLSLVVEDAGAWSYRTYPLGWPLRFLVSPQTGWIYYVAQVDATGRLYVSKDGALTWSDSSLGLAGDIRLTWIDVSGQQDDVQAAIVGGEIVRSTDQGDTWDPVPGPWGAQATRLAPMASDGSRYLVGTAQGEVFMVDVEDQPTSASAWSWGQTKAAVVVGQCIEGHCNRPPVSHQPDEKIGAE